MNIPQQINYGPVVAESGNYAYSIPEAAGRWKLYWLSMFDRVRTEYRRQNVMPVCVLCEKDCKMKCDRKNELWHCNGFTMSAHTIGQFPKC